MQITELLQRVQAGDRQALNTVILCLAKITPHQKH